MIKSAGMQLLTMNNFKRLDTKWRRMYIIKILTKPLINNLPENSTDYNMGHGPDGTAN